MHAHSHLSLSVLLHRVIAFGRALLVGGGLTLVALISSAHTRHAHAPPDEQPAAAGVQSTIEPRNALPADDLRGGEQVELVSIEVRSAPRPPTAGSSLAASRSVPGGAPHADPLRWCDVVQCRRLSGALLLGFATPPPTHS